MECSTPLAEPNHGVQHSSCRAKGRRITHLYLGSLIHEPACSGNNETCVGAGQAAVAGSEQIRLQQYRGTVQVDGRGGRCKQGVQGNGQGCLVIICLAGKVDALVVWRHGERKKNRPDLRRGQAGKERRDEELLYMLHKACQNPLFLKENKYIVISKGYIFTLRLGRAMFWVKSLIN